MAARARPRKLREFHASCHVHEDRTTRAGERCHPLGDPRATILIGGTGRDEIDLEGNTVATKGSIKMTGGNGSNTVDLDGARASVGKRGGI